MLSLQTHLQAFYDEKRQAIQSTIKIMKCIKITENKANIND